MRTTKEVTTVSEDLQAALVPFKGGVLATQAQLRRQTRRSTMTVRDLVTLAERPLLPRTKDGHPSTDIVVEHKAIVDSLTNQLMATQDPASIPVPVILELPDGDRVLLDGQASVDAIANHWRDNQTAQVPVEIYQPANPNATPAQILFEAASAVMGEESTRGRRRQQSEREAGLIGCLTRMAAVQQQGEKLPSLDELEQVFRLRRQVIAMARKSITDAMAPAASEEEIKQAASRQVRSMAKHFVQELLGNQQGEDEPELVSVTTQVRTLPHAPGSADVDTDEVVGLVEDLMNVLQRVEGLRERLKQANTHRPDRVGGMMFASIGVEKLYEISERMKHVQRILSDELKARRIAGSVLSNADALSI